MSEKALCDVLYPDEFLGGRDYRIWDCYSEHQSTFNNRLHFHSFYEMSIIYEGKTDFLISGNKFSLKNHSIQLVRPSDYHKQMTAEGEYFKYFNILFTPEFISEDMRVEIEKDSVPLCINVNESDWRDMLKLTKNAYDKFSCTPDDPLTKILIRSAIESICVYLLRHIQTEKCAYEDSSYEPLRRAITYIHKNYREDLKLSDVAAQAGLSPTYFSAVFHKYIGTSFCHYLTDYRIQAAEKYLRSSDLSLKVIASVCGFTSYSHFVTVFKKYYGVSPSERKRRNSEKKL